MLPPSTTRTAGANKFQVYPSRNIFFKEEDVTALDDINVRIEGQGGIALVSIPAQAVHASLEFTDSHAQDDH